MKAPKYNHKANNLVEATGLLESAQKGLEPEFKNGLNWVARRTALVTLVVENKSLSLVLEGLTGLDFSTKSELVEYLDKYLSDTDIIKSIMALDAEKGLTDMIERFEKMQEEK